MLSYKQLKRIIAACAFGFGFVFTALILLSVWNVADFNFYENTTASGKLIPTTAVLTLAFICLLAILKMAENRT